MRKKIENEQIYTAALKNFARFGYNKTTLADIAAELGVTKSNLYIYTASKHSLYKETVAYALIQWQTRVKTAIEHIDDPREKLVTLCVKAFTYLDEDKTFCEILRNDPEIFPFSNERDPYADINGESINMLKSIISEGIQRKLFKQVPIEGTALMFFSIYKMFIIQTYIKKEHSDVPHLFDLTVNLLTTGLFN